MFAEFTLNDFRFRRSSGAGSGGVGGGGSSVGAGGGGSRRGSQQPAVVADDQRSVSASGGAGSDCEAPESGSSNVLRITEYVTSRTIVPANRTGNSRPTSNNYDDEDDGDGEADDDEPDCGEAFSSENQPVRRGHRGGGGGGSGGASLKPRTSDYESSDSPNSSDHCEEISATNSRCSVVEDDQQPIVIRTEMEELDCSYPIPPAETDEENFIVNRVPNSCLFLTVSLFTSMTNTFSIKKKLNQKKRPIIRQEIINQSMAGFGHPQND